ncbi:MAG TPA: haloacid dehalogenase-like hydrolase [Streptosporangiaceae bacterium]|nr:haloacid dehalogenase-like hydrolase [Streptosporangiaceae bacterium]
MRTLVLWDIDHTLVDVGALSGELYAEAFQKATGQPLGELADLTGQTDQAIITRTLELHGLPTDAEAVATFAEAVAGVFRAARGVVAERGRSLPGAEAALADLAGRPGLVQSVLTGNMRSIAELKLGVFGLARYLDLDVGAYGMDGTARSALVQTAMRRAAERYGSPFSVESTVLIGDTPRDVAAALETGVRVVAVATGSSDMAMLAAAGAETVLPSLADTASVTKAVLAHL